MVQYPTHQWLKSQCSVIQEVTLDPYRNMDTIATPPLICDQQSAGVFSEEIKARNICKGHWNTNAQSVHTVRKFQISEKSLSSTRNQTCYRWFSRQIHYHWVKRPDNLGKLICKNWSSKIAYCLICLILLINNIFYSTKF